MWEQEQGLADADTALGQRPARRNEAYDVWLGRLQALTRGGGPQPSEFERLTTTLREIQAARESGQLSEDRMDGLRQALGDALGAGTLQGRCWLKPYGYAGDFQIIDDIYQGVCSPNPQLSRWDQYFQKQASVQAVRNRKAYFKALVLQVWERAGRRPITVLNVASGPCRDVQELLRAEPDLPVHIHCVDMDPKALDHARVVCTGLEDRVSFRQANALRLRLSERFDLVWSAGLFDYLEDRSFMLLLSRLMAHAQPQGGEVVVGNFARDNPTRPYQEFTDWILIHRSAVQMQRLALACGAAARAVRVEHEPLRINLFLRVKV